ncbi:phosphoglycerate kinase [Nanoarchaeota archaeon]
MTDFKRTVKDVDLSGKTVFLRVAYDLPLDSSKELLDPSRIADDSRILDSLPTIKSILDQKPSKFLIAAGWMGRPKGEDKEFTMAPAVLRLKQLLKEANYDVEVLLTPNCLDGAAPRSVYRNQEEVKKAVEDLQPNQILMFENVRYDKEANKGDPGFGEFMGSLAGQNAIYVNEAEPQNHRPEATIKLVPGIIIKNGGDAVFGFKYIDVMDKIGGMGAKLKDDGRGPFVFYLSGKKIEVQPGITSKISVTNSLLDSMKEGDKLIVQGAVTYTFLASSEYYSDIDSKKSEIQAKLDELRQRISSETEGLDSEAATNKEQDIRKEVTNEILGLIGITLDDVKKLIGSSYMKKGQEGEQLFFAYQVLAKAKEKHVEVLINEDHIITNAKPNKQGILPEEAEIKIHEQPTGIPEGWMGIAPGPNTLSKIESAYGADNGISLQAGPVQIEDLRVEEISKANQRIGQATRDAKAKGWITIAAGGDTAAETARFNNKDAYTVISNAGGATLELIESGTSVGAEAIKEALK